MNAKTLEAVVRHGRALLLAFPNAVERDPVVLCKKVRRIETATSKHAENLCNIPNYQTTWDTEKEKAKARLVQLLGISPAMSEQVFINGDPRGYALKIEDTWARPWNEERRAKSEPVLYTDMGGYGIIAPDLTEE